MWNLNTDLAKGEAKRQYRNLRRQTDVTGEIRQKDDYGMRFC